jgi:hypothetical protein
VNKRPITAREFATRKYKPRNYTYRHNSIWKVRVSAFLEGVEWARKTEVHIGGSPLRINVALCTSKRRPTRKKVRP